MNHLRPFLVFVLLLLVTFTITLYFYQQQYLVIQHDGFILLSTLKSESNYIQKKGKSLLLLGILLE